MLGYNGSLAVSAVDPATTTISGGGVLGLTSLTLSSGAVTVSETYTKAEVFKIKVLDTALSLGAFSSTMAWIFSRPISTIAMASAAPIPARSSVT